VTVTSTDLLRSRGQGLRGVLVELGFVGLAAVLNLAVRAYTVDDLETAVANAHDVLALQQDLGIDWERAVQDATLAAPWLSSFCAWFYVWGYFPVVGLALVWLYLRRPATYAVLRNAVLVSGAVGLAAYAFYPCAPPRLAGLGYTDTVATSVLDAAARPGGFANELAAIPSFHVGWLMLVGVVVFRVTRSVPLRILCVVHPALMSYAVVATGNHWVLDIPAGAAITVVGLYGAGRIRASRQVRVATAV
jgi:hypothetical protein